jgi:hypothetical protein
MAEHFPFRLDLDYVHWLNCHKGMKKKRNDATQVHLNYAVMSQRMKYCEV